MSEALAVTEAGYRVLSTRCLIRGHGNLIRRSDIMGDHYCPSCQSRHFRAYVLGTSPGRRLVQTEAVRRGGTCEFTLTVGGETRRCLARFEDGGLEWHHLNPAEKLAAISSLAKGTRLSVLEEELAKCQLLCRWHHRRMRR